MTRPSGTRRRAWTRSGIRGAAGSTVAVLIVLIAGSNAWAHAELVASAPRPGEAVADPPSEVVLTFSEELLDAGADVVVSDGDDLDLTATDPIVDGDLVTVELERLADGDYEVMWRVVSADGHPILGSFSFFVGTVVDEAQAPPAAASTDPGPAGTEAADDGIADGVLPWVVPLTLAAGMAVGVTWWLAGRRHRHRRERA